MEKLSQEFKYYKDHQDELVGKYAGKFIVIVDNQVVGNYASRDQAIKESLKTYKLGSFFIQYVESGSESFTQTFHSRVMVHGR